MAPELKEMIEKGTVNEIELVEFIRTLKKLSKNNVMDSKNFQLVLGHFGLKEKEGWVKFGDDVKYKLD